MSEKMPEQEVEQNNSGRLISDLTKELSKERSTVLTKGENLSLRAKNLAELMTLRLLNANDRDYEKVLSLVKTTQGRLRDQPEIAHSKELMKILNSVRGRLVYKAHFSYAVENFRKDISSGKISLTDLPELSDDLKSEEGKGLDDLVKDYLRAGGVDIYEYAKNALSYSSPDKSVYQAAAASEKDLLDVTLVAEARRLETEAEAIIRQDLVDLGLVELEAPATEKQSIVHRIKDGFGKFFNGKTARKLAYVGATVVTVAGIALGYVQSVVSNKINDKSLTIAAEKPAQVLSLPKNLLPKFVEDVYAGEEEIPAAVPLEQVIEVIPPTKVSPLVLSNEQEPAYPMTVSQVDEKTENNLVSNYESMRTGNPENTLFFSPNYKEISDENKEIKWVKPDMIILHWAGNPQTPDRWTTDIVYNGLAERKYDTPTGKRAGDAHFATGVDGVLQILPMKEDVVRMSYTAQGYPNSINIEMSGSYFTADEFGNTNVPEEEFNATLDLVVKLMVQYNLKWENVVGHYERDTIVVDGQTLDRGKLDPGPEFMAHFKKKLAEKLNQLGLDFGQPETVTQSIEDDKKANTVSTISPLEGQERRARDLAALDALRARDRQQGFKSNNARAF